MKLVKDSSFLPEAGQNHHRSFLLPITFRLKTISLVVVLAPQGETSCVCGWQCWCGTACHNPGKRMANVLPNHMLVMHWQRLKILVAYITEVNPVSLCLSPEASSSPKGISTGFAGVWWWEVHKAVTNKKGSSFKSGMAENAWCWVFVHLYNVIV